MIEWILFAGVLLFFLPNILPFFLNPIFLWFKQREFVDPHFEVIAASDLLPEAQAHFETARSDLEALGFCPCALTKIGNPMGNALVFCEVWYHELDGISATVISAYMLLSNQPPKFFSQSISFVTRFSETHQWETANSDVPSPLAMIPSRPCVQLPQLKSARELFWVHQRLAAKFNSGNERLRPERGRELALLARKIGEINRHQVSVGRWQPDRQPSLFRPTWKGAVINGWQYAAPVQRIRRWLAVRRAQKILSSLG